MGYIIDQSGVAHVCEHISGSINLSHILSDIECIDYTIAYRRLCIEAILKTGLIFNISIRRQLMGVIHLMPTTNAAKYDEWTLKTLSSLSPNFGEG